MSRYHDDSLQDWQRRQAMKAVELYLNVFLPEANCIAHPPSPRLRRTSGAEGMDVNVDAFASETARASSRSADTRKRDEGVASTIGAAQNGNEKDALREMKDLMKRLSG